MVSRYNNGYGGIPNQNTAAPNHHNPHGMMAAMTMVRPHRPHPPPPTSQQIQQHAANVVNLANHAAMPNQNTGMKPMNHTHDYHAPAQSNLGPQNHSQHQQVNKVAQQQQIPHNNVNANHHNAVQVPHSTYRAMHPRQDSYHAPQNVAGGFVNTVTGHHNQQIVRGAMPQSQQSQIDGAQKNQQPQVYQPQQRQNQQQPYQRQPTKNLNPVGVRQPMNNQQTLNNQIIGAQGSQPMYIPAAPQYTYTYAPNGAVIYNQAPLQYPGLSGYRPYGQPVYFASSLGYSQNAPRVSGPQIASVPVQPTMSSSALSQQNMMASQVGTPPVQAAPVSKRPSRAIPIVDPLTKEPIMHNPSVDVSETESTASTLDNDCSSETGRSDDLPPPFIPGQPLTGNVIVAQQLLQTDTPIVSANMDGPDITPKQNINKNKKKNIEVQKQPIDVVNEVKSSQSDEVTVEITQEPVPENIQTSTEPEFEANETISEIGGIQEKMSPPLPPPVAVIESALSYDAKSFEPKKQREQAQRESVERSNENMALKQGQTISEPTSDTNKNIITTNSSLPPSKKDETDSLSTSTISPEKIDETTSTTTTSVIDNKNTLDSNIVNNNTIIKVEDSSFKKEKSTTPVSVMQPAQDSSETIVDNTELIDETSKVADQINANIDAVPVPAPVAPAPAKLHASKTAPSTLVQHQPQHRKSEETIKLDKPIKSAGSRSLERPKPAIEYHEDQWSPENPEGKRKYTLDQLKVLGKTEVAKEKPNLPSNLQLVLTPSAGGKPRQEMRNFMMPDFMKQGNIGLYNKRPSQPGNRGQGQGNKSGSRNQDVKRISLKMNDVQLKEVENAWKPKMLQGEDNRTKEERETDELMRKFRSTLNKLTPENFDILVNDLMSAQIDTVARLKGCIELVFEKAISEPNYCVVYAKICKRLSTINIPHEQVPNSTNQKPVTFRVLLLNQCQHEFEKHKDDTSGQTKKNEEIEKETDEVKRKQLKEQQEEEAFKIRRRAVGTVKFIGELYKIDMLVDKIMLSCISLLLDNGDEDSLECLCKLLTTVGQRMENAKDKSLETYFKKLNDISDKRAKVQVSSRIRFAIKDVIDLRKNRWQPRRNESNPKTMGQIQKELDTEHRNIEILNYQTPRKDDRRGGSMNKYSNKKQDSDGGWMTPSTKNTRPQQNTFDIGKVNTNISGAAETMKLGPQTGFQQFMTNRFATLPDESSSGPPISGGSSGLSRDNQPYNSNKYDNYSNNSNNRGNIHRQNSRENSRHRNDMNGPSRSFQANSLSRQSSSGRDDRDRSNTNVHSQSQIISRRSQQAESTSSSEPLPTFDYETEPSSAELEKIKSTIKPMINCSVEDFAIGFKQQINRKHRWVAIREMHLISLDHQESWREAVSRSCHHCLTLNDPSLLTLAEYKNAIRKYCEFLIDIEDDYPKLFEYNAVLFGEPMHGNFLTLKDIYSYSSELINNFKGGKMLVKLLEHFLKNYGADRVRKIWATSGLQIKQFLGDDGSDDQKVADFIAANKLEYLTDSKSVAQVSSTKLTDASKIQGRLQELLKSKSSSNDDQMIHEWIQANVENTGSKEFIRALTTVAIEYCIQNEKLVEDLFVNRANDLLRKYIDGKGDRELQVLYAVQYIVKRLEYPQGLLYQICSALSDHYTVSREGFMAWKDDNTAEAMDAEGKGVCMISLTNFFLNISEASDSEDCDEEEIADPNTAA